MFTGNVALSVTNTSSICTWTYNIAWGDGDSSSFVSTPGSTQSATHKYLRSGFYTITVDIPPGSSSDPNRACGSLIEQHLVEVPGPNTFINTPPAPTSGSIANSRDASFTYTSNVGSVTFECSLDDSPFSDCTSQPKSYSDSDLADGQHTFQVRAKDANGYEDLSPATRTWTVDGTPPSLNITDGPDGETYAAGSTQTWNFTARDTTSGITSVQCSVVTTGSPASFGACAGGNSSHSVINKPSGSYTFTVKARDNGGLETTQSRMFSIAAAPPPDTTAPTVLDNSSSLEPDRGAPGAPRTTNVSATFSEEMRPDSLTSSTFKLQKYNKKTRKWKTIPATLSLSSDNKTATLDPFGATEPVGTENPLAANKKFRGFITTGAKDLAGNPLASKFIWIFKTGG